jgi:hypothetical protein
VSIMSPSDFLNSRKVSGEIRKSPARYLSLQNAGASAGNLLYSLIPI